MSEIKTKFLFSISLEFDISILGDPPYGLRRILKLNAGRFHGARLSGAVRWLDAYPSG